MYQSSQGFWLIRLVPDFLATYSLDDVSAILDYNMIVSGLSSIVQDTFGTFIWLTDVPTSGNSPHHLGSTQDGKTLVGGGLLSLLKTQVREQ